MAQIGLDCWICPPVCPPLTARQLALEMRRSSEKIRGVKRNGCDGFSPPAVVLLFPLSWCWLPLFSPLLLSLCLSSSLFTRNGGNPGNIEPMYLTSLSPRLASTGAAAEVEVRGAWPRVRQRPSEPIPVPFSHIAFLSSILFVSRSLACSFCFNKTSSSCPEFGPKSP